MVTVVILSVAFLALATLMAKAQSAKQQTDRLQQAQFLAKKKMSELIAVDFADLGTGNDAQSNWQFGPENGVVVSSPLLNRSGIAQADGGVPPFIFTVSFVVCLDDGYGGKSWPGIGDACGDLTLLRPDALSCDISRTEDGQAEIRVLATYRDRDGRCHKVALSSIAVDMEIS